MDNTLVLSENIQATQYDEVGWSGFHAENPHEIDDDFIKMDQDHKWNPVFSWLAIDASEDPLPFGARINEGRDRQLPAEPVERAILARPSSSHPGGVNAAFASGKSTFLSETIEYVVYQQLMTPDAAKSNMPRPNYVLSAQDF